MMGPMDLLQPGWHMVIDPRDWAQATRMHESTHVTASEALGIPVIDVWANVDPHVAHGGQYRNGLGDSQHQATVYAIGSEGGAHELRERGYPDALAHAFTLACGAADRQMAADLIPDAAAQGYRVDADLAYDVGLQILHSPGFVDTARAVADAMADRGDLLTGADVRAAMGDFELDQGLWLPTSPDITTPEAHQHSLQPALEYEFDDDIDL